MVEIEIGVQVMLQVMIETILIDLMNVVVPMVPEVMVIVAPHDPYGGDSDSSSSSELGK